MVLSDWDKIKIQDDNRDFWVKFYNRENGRSIHVCSQIGNKMIYVEMAWLTHKYKLFSTRIKALEYAKECMRCN